MDLTQASNAMNFTENQQGSAILEKLKLQREAGRFCDVVFHVKDKQYLAHRNVLAACSPYFDSMLKMNKVAKEHLTVSCQNYEVFEVLLNYLYTGKVIIDRNLVSELLRLANHFMIAKLKEHCSEYLERNLNLANCFATKDQADKCGCLPLKQTVEYFIMTNISEILKQNEVLDFPMNKMEILLSNKGFPISEDQKVWIVVRWVKHNVKEREQHFRSLLSYIHWSKVSIDDLYEFIKIDELFSFSERCLYYILAVLEESGYLYDAYNGILQQLKAKVTQSGPSLDTETVIQLAVSAAIGEFHNNSTQCESESKEDIKADVKPSVPEKDKIEEEKPQVTVKFSSQGEIHAKQSLPKVPEPEPVDHHDDNDDTIMDDDISSDESPPPLVVQTETRVQVIKGGTSKRKAAKAAARPAKAAKPAVQPVEPEPELNGPVLRNRHKRKGIPVKVRIPKSKLKKSDLSLIPKVPKRRGRPPKKFYSDQLRKDMKKLKVPKKKKVPTATLR